MQTALCPSSETLKDLLLGNLSRHERESLEEHLLTCNRCVSEAETIVADDDLTALTRAATTLPDDDADALAALIDKIKQARSHAETVGFGETLPGDLPPGSPAAAAETYNLSFLAPAQSEDELGRLGDYRILEVLGAGGMGLVLRAEDTKLRRQVALKTMKAAIAESPTAKVRFTREAQATAALEHDHIVPIYQVGEDRGIPFIAMQYLRGESLHTRLQKLGKLAPAEVVRIGKEVASGLAMAHEHDLTHRDIKPDNIWIETKTNRAKILDFGLVSATAEDEGLTHSGTVLGTPRYMSPEQALGHPVDHRSDLFSLGSVLYQAVTGEPPFAGSNFTSTLIAVAHQPPVPLQNAASELHPEVASIIMQLLEKDPGKRPQSASEVAERFAELEQLLKRVSIQVDNHDQLSDTVSYEHPIKSPKLPPGKPPRRPLLLAGAGGLAALLLGILVITIRDKDGKETTIRVPSGTEIEVDAQPESKVTIREEAGSEPRTTAKTMDPNDEATTDPDRRLAIFVLSREKPGSVVIRRSENPFGEQFTIEDIEQLPSWPFVVVWATVLSNVSDADLALFGTVRNLERLVLVAENHELTDDGIDTLSRTAIAESLNSWIVYTAPKLTDACIPSLNRFSNLTELTFQGQRNLTDAGVKQLSLPNLVGLDLLCTTVSSQALSDGSIRFPNLKQLRLDNIVVTDDLSNISDLKLTELRLGDSNVGIQQYSVRQCENIGKIRSLSFLDLAHEITDDGLSKLTDLKELKTLFIVNAFRLTNEANESLSRLTSLEQLNLSVRGDNQSLQELSGLTRLPELKSASIFNVAIDDTQLEALAQIPKLERLSLTRCPNITERGIRNLQQRLPNCVIEIDLIKISESGSESLGVAVRNIEFDLERKIAERLLRLDKGRFVLGNKERQPMPEWSLTNLPSEPFCILDANFDGADLLDEELAVLKGCQALQSLRLNDNRQLTATGLKRIGTLPSLNRLWADGTPIGNDLFDWLSGSPNIKELYLTNTSITGDGLERLPALPNLESLGLNCGIAQPGIEAVVSRCGNLKQLMIYVSSGENLTALSKLKQLNSFHTDESILSETGIQTLRQMPALENLFVDSPTPEGVERLAALKRKLVILTLREQQPVSSLITESGAWDRIVHMSGLTSLNIGGNLAVDAKLLDRFASMIHLKELRIEYLTDDKLAKAHRRFSDKDVLSFRNKRPDLALTINGTTYPALDDWPGKFEGSASIVAWDLPADAPSPAIVPFTPEEAAQYQAAWAKYLKVPVESENSIGMKFRVIPPGEFTSVNESSTYSPTTVALERLPNAYELGMTEVTVAQFQAFVKATGYITEAERLANADSPQLEGGWSIPRDATWRTPGYVVQPTMPVTLVSMSDANAFCEWLSKTEGKKYRLPTAVEWNFAVFGSGEFRYGWWSDAEVLQQEWFANNLPSGVQGPQPVASKASNPFGLYDAIGNVCELALSGYYSCGRQGYGWTHNSNVPSKLVGINFWGISADTGFRILRSLAPSTPIDKSFVLIPRHSPLSPVATVSRPAMIPGIRSWSVERISHSLFADHVHWSPRGDLIATSSNDYSVRLWDRAGKLKTLLIGHRGPVRSLSFSPDGKLLASISGGPAISELRVWDVDSGRCIREASDEYFEPRLRFSPSGDRLAVQGVIRGHSMMEILDLDTLTPFPLPVLATSGAFAWSKDGGAIFGFHTDGLVEVQVSDRQVLRKFDLDFSEDEIRGTKEIAISPDGLTLAIVTPSTLRLLDLQRSVMAPKFSLGFQSVLEVQWAPIGQQLLIVGNNDKADHIQVFDVPTGAISMRLNGYSDESSAWSPDGTEIAFFNRSGNTLTFINSSTGQLLRVVPAWYSSSHRPKSQLSSSEDKLVVGNKEFSATSGNLIRTQKVVPGPLLLVSPTDQWRAYTRKATEIEIVPSNFDRDSITLSVPMINGTWRTNPTGDLIAQANGQDIAIWSTETGQQQLSLNHPANVWSFEWSPDGRQIASMADDECVRIWDSETLRLVSTFSDFPTKLAPIFYIFGATSARQWSADNRHLWIPQTQGWARLDTHTGSVDRRGTETLNHCSSLVLAPNEQRLLFRDGYGWTTLASADGAQTRLGVNLGISAQWHDDSRRFIGSDLNGLIAYDAVSNRRLGTLWADLPDGHWMCVGPTGHCRGSKGVAEHVVYVAQLDDGSNITLSPQEFAKRFGWKNDPEKATLLGLDE